MSFIRGMKDKKGLRADKMSFIKGMKDKNRLKAGENVLHKGYEGQKEVGEQTKCLS